MVERKVIKKKRSKMMFKDKIAPSALFSNWKRIMLGK